MLIALPINLRINGTAFHLQELAKKAVISDRHEPEGQNMEQKTADEFPGTQRHFRGSIVVLPIFREAP